MEKILDSHCVEWRCGAVDPVVNPLLFVASYLRFGAFCCPLPSTGITQLHWYYGPIRRPKMPGLSVTGVRLVVPDHTMGFPVLLALSLCTCCHQYPAQRLCSYLLSSYSRARRPRYAFRVVLRIGLFEVFSAFTRVAACTLALPPLRGKHYPKASAISLPP